MRSLLLIPVTLALTAAGGMALCAVASLPPHPRELTFALAVTGIASAAGVLPIVLARHATQMGLSQAGLVGTMAHLMAGAALVAVVTLGGFALHRAFIYWTMAFYATSLAALVVVTVRAIKAAPPAAAAMHKA